ncbi:MAG: class I SAM-dependent methyltransferase [Kineosporiaceae bacterium]
MTSGPAADWASWLARFDAQAEVYVPARERRFDVMIEVLEALVPAGATVLDIGCGPGSLASRVGTRLPEATVLALDADPVLLGLGRRAVGDLGGRLRWVLADLLVGDWRTSLGVDRVDAVVSGAALHWFPPEDLVRVLRDVAGLLAPGGVFLNGDVLPLPLRLPSVVAALDDLEDRREESARAAGAEDWEQWWQAVRDAGVLAAEFAERDRSELVTRRQRQVAGAAFHEAALRELGFREVTPVWQDLEEFVVLAVR